ncbi:hypothetical protein [Rheinheimera metallidurans]|uniref:hypothetical protein n=1 Tax=Rheinheimera metallidurans TaxID=2925781 RepID=UPI003002694F
MKTLHKTLLISGLTALLSMPASADDIDDAIATATKHYKAGELSQAIAQLDYASTLIRQEKGEQVKKVFPAPPSGWKADEASSDVAGAAMFGGGINASRAYYNDNSRIEIQLMMDSPMLQAFSMMLSNPSMIAMSGGKLTKIQGIQAVQKIDGDSVEIQFVTPSGAMVTLSGDKAAQSTLLELANAIDLKKL